MQWTIAHQARINESHLSTIGSINNHSWKVRDRGSGAAGSFPDLHIFRAIRRLSTRGAYREAALIQGGELHGLIYTKHMVSVEAPGRLSVTRHV